MRKGWMVFLLGAFSLCCFCPTGSRAQDRQSWRFRSMGYIGVVQGQEGGYAQGRVVNGWTKKTWYIGLGTGIDGYLFTSVPLYLSVNKDLIRGRRSCFFAGLDGGTNLPLDHPAPPSSIYEVGDVPPKLYAGAYGNAGLGYRLRLSEKNTQALAIWAGYSYKAIKEVIPLVIYTPNQESTPYYTNDYRTNRYSMAIGWVFP